MTITRTEQRRNAATRWAVDRAKTTVEFDVNTFWGLAVVHGRFNRFDGSYEVGPDGAKIVLTIDVDSIDTGNRKRDEHLRAADFFHIAEEPQVRFTSTHVRDAGSGTLHVEGELQAAGRTVPLEFEATVQQVGRGLQIEATTTVDQRQFGMSSGTLGMIRGHATLRVKSHLEPATRKRFDVEFGARGDGSDQAARSERAQPVAVPTGKPDRGEMRRV